ncbi:2-oxoglutarate ferredoxin oxidoreductase subunit alpha [Thermaurantimonas aggregans]|uniref:2-oxoglutarate ferredoxin oxidoreductase subunit alpha n=1 Tax=Thermaurantimonas aggregans TaxID=2173829 RepID=A0A401XKB9_9FLAO|nr:2-oxoacid:acceptor oxidoreductase subunit alpha [Thermaurantimonas aggregans]MCX8148352.1 2-oxoacid:acceptor oxidoreductase subunit alpha [Thermaurantimonas aggregans]GCD77458.1 2-oxoglutarate ferredoxin oxidoreductase subunit alpha [Thermaurantimonas aggregans]
MGNVKTIEKATVLFAGDSGDGIQLAGMQFSMTTAIKGNDLSTFPDFPAEIRAPAGTVSGVSGFKINFGSTEIYTPGGQVDTLVVMNAAALKKNLSALKPGGLIIANTNGFDKRNLELANIPPDKNPLTDGSLSNYKLIEVECTKLTREALKHLGLSTRDMDRSRNMFMLGLVYWLYTRDLEPTIKFFQQKFSQQPTVQEANITALRAGYHFGETIEATAERFVVEKAQLPAGTYRSITGNEAIAIGLVTAAKKAGLKLFYGSYPITPASDILHLLSSYKAYDVYTFQAEDEIAAIGSAIGASYGGNLAATGTSGPGMALKTEAIGLAVMLEIPLVIIDVQRGGPSTGLPTKTEQADLFQAIHGRNGEAPLPVLAASTPADCFDVTFEACRIAIEHMTPVILLSDGYIANGAEPWLYPSAEQLPKITVKHPTPEGEVFMPYKRDEDFVRGWATPGTPGMMHRIGGLEKEDITGAVSYDPENHQKMVNIRLQKILNIANYLPDAILDEGEKTGDLLIIGWGSTYGAIKVAVQDLRKKGHRVSQMHLKYLFPLQKNVRDLVKGFSNILIPELNMGQLAFYLKAELGIKPFELHKVKGQPFLAKEIEDEAIKILTKNLVETSL